MKTNFSFTNSYKSKAKVNGTRMEKMTNIYRIKYIIIEQAENMYEKINYQFNVPVLSRLFNKKITLYKIYLSNSKLNTNPAKKCSSGELINQFCTNVSSILVLRWFRMN